MVLEVDLTSSGITLEGTSDLFGVNIDVNGAIEYNGYKNQFYCQCHTRVKTYLGNIEPRFA